jgi:hypothetical protein
MSKVGNAITKARTKLAAKAGKFMPDLCDLLDPVRVNQGSGHTLTEGVVASNVPCRIDQVSGGVSFHDGESVANKAGKLELPYTAATAGITRQYKIRVHARDVNPQMVFEQPIISTDSMSPLLQVSAILTEGYRVPGIR